MTMKLPKKDSYVRVEDDTILFKDEDGEVAVGHICVDDLGNKYITIDYDNEVIGSYLVTWFLQTLEKK